MAIASHEIQVGGMTPQNPFPVDVCAPPATAVPSVRRKSGGMLEGLLEGKSEMRRGTSGGIEHVWIIGGGEIPSDITEENRGGLNIIDATRSVFAGALEAREKILPALVSEFKETVGTSFNKYLFTLMNAAGLAIVTYLGHSADRMDWVIQDEQLYKTVNDGLNSVGLDATSSYVLVALGAIDLLLTTTARAKELAKDKDIWQINSTMAAFSLVMVGFIGKALSDDPTLVQKLAHDIFVR